MAMTTIEWTPEERARETEWRAQSGPRALTAEQREFLDMVDAFVTLAWFVPLPTEVERLMHAASKLGD
jgi:hypothetical protein